MRQKMRGERKGRPNESITDAETVREKERDREERE